MNTKTKLVFAVVVAIVLIFGIGLSLSQRQPEVKPSWVQQVQWQEEPTDAAAIEELLWTEIAPYRTDYETVNISATTTSQGLRLKVVATSKETDKQDIYDFTCDDKELLMTGYLLEAIPSQYRNDAIAIALGNQEVAASVTNVGVPTVRRILPKTSEKYYAPKTLLSVTWNGVSVLVDPDERRVVQVWKADTQQGYKK